MTQPPPALSLQEQFTPEYWAKVPRDMTKAKLTRITKLADESDNEFIEFVFDTGDAFQRRWAELDQGMFHLLHANLEVFVQTIRGELVTGLFIPQNGWVFKMSPEDLAEYAKKLASAIHKQREVARGELLDFMALTIRDAVFAQTGRDPEGVDWQAVAGTLMGAMQQAKPNSSANA